MTYPAQPFPAETKSNPHGDDLIWLLASMAPIGAFSALVAGSPIWAIAMTLVLVAVIVFHH